jgi:glutamyl-tRNA synthetase
MTVKPRFRFCPSPTGVPHVGLIRTALFNWAYSKHLDGTFVFRIEDTDPARDTQKSYTMLLEALKWLGLSWDEGVEVGGKYGPYRQSQRMDIYKDIIKKLIDNGFAYKSYSTQEEIKNRNIQNGRPENFGYDGYDKTLTQKEINAFKLEGRIPAIRFIMPQNK